MVGGEGGRRRRDDHHQPTVIALALAVDPPVEGRPPVLEDGHGAQRNDHPGPALGDLAVGGGEPPPPPWLSSEKNGMFLKVGKKLTFEDVQFALQGFHLLPRGRLVLLGRLHSPQQSQGFLLLRADVTAAAAATSAAADADAHAIFAFIYFQC